MSVELEEPLALNDTIQALLRAMITQTMEIQRLIETVRESQPQTRGLGRIPSMEQAVADYERSLIETALETSRGNRTQAARLLQVTPRIINYKIRKYSIDCSRFR